MSALQQYLDLYSSQRQLLEQNSCAIMNAQRSAALRRLERSGLPTRKDERYKYTDLKTLLAPDFGLNLRRLPVSGTNPADTYRCNIPNMGADVIHIINDTPHIPPQLLAPDYPATVTTFCQADASLGSTIASHYNQLAAAGDTLADLNTLLAQDGLIISLPDGARLPRPLQIVSIASSSAPLMANRRLLLLWGKNTDGTVVFCDESPTPQASLCTQVTEIFCAEGARLDICSLEETNPSHTRLNHLFALQAAGSRLRYNGLTLHNGLTRNTLDIRLSEPGASVEARGAVVANGREHVDNNLLIDHAAPDCQSELLYKYVLDDTCTGAFAGKVLVREGAQHTVSQQTNANLCVSTDARAYTQPMLEIYADDVKCNHGATVGKLDETALFYMQQRGIPEAEARLLLQHAFVNDVLQRVTLEPLRERLSQLVERRFRGTLKHCEGCKMTEICH